MNSCAERTLTRKKLLIATWFYQDQPGYLDFSYRIRSLATRFDTTVLARNAITQNELLVEGVKYEVIATKGTSKKDLMQYCLAIAKQAMRDKPAAVVLLGSQLAAAALLIRRIPTCVYWNEHPSHFMDSASINPIRKLVGQFVSALTYAGARGATVVMPIGEAHRDELLEKGVSRNKLAMIYMGVHPLFRPVVFQTQEFTACPIRLIYTGSVMRDRGRDVMLEGLSIANRGARVATLTIVGASPDQVHYCKRRAIELGIAADVTVHGRVPGYEIPELLKGMDMGVCIWDDKPYWRFNPPTKLFEYLVAGLPVLASNIRTHTQYVGHGHNGVIFEYDAQAFATAVTSVATGTHSLASMRVNAINDGKQFLWPHVEPVFLAAIDEHCGCTIGEVLP